MKREVVECGAGWAGNVLSGRYRWLGTCLQYRNAYAYTHLEYEVTFYAVVALNTNYYRPNWLCFKIMFNRPSVD